MAASINPPDHDPRTGKSRTRPTLLYLILGLIVAGFLAFLILKPNPSGIPQHPGTASGSDSVAPIRNK